MLLDSVLRTGKNYYSQMFWEGCKCVFEEKKILEYITDDTDEYFPDSDIFWFLILIKKILLKKVLTKKILLKKVLTKKILIKKIKYRMWIRK